MVTNAPPLPKTMRAAVATGFGHIAANIHCEPAWPVPQLDDKQDGWMLIRVLACALAPGDVRVLSGKTDYVQLPPGGHPYVVGSDTAGMVVRVSTNETKFRPGDYVVARFDEPKPCGGVAEYRLVKTKLSEKCPASIPPVQACGLSASAAAAKRVVRQFVQPAHRVLVLGGSGAVGSCVLQYCKLQGAKHVVAVSTQTEQCERLGAHQVIDYRTTKWWEVPAFAEDPFDTVIDLVDGENWVVGAHACKAIKASGTYVALPSGVETEIEAHGIWGMVCVAFAFVGRMAWSRLHPNLPKWVAPEALKLEDGDLKELLEDVVQGRLQPVVDPASPFAFTNEGVRDAFQLQQSKHAHGKVVIEIADK